jgi:hypothetical protein
MADEENGVDREDNAEWCKPVNAKDIVFEGFLRVRASTGFAGLRPWLLR